MSENLKEENIENENINEDINANLKEEEENDSTIEKKFLEEKDKFLRIIAEYENKMKRTQMDAFHAINVAISNLIKNFTPIIDDLTTVSNLFANEQKDSVDLIIKNMKKILFQNGVTEIIPKEKDIFDPKQHQAIASEESSFEEGLIIKTIKPGYKFQEETVIPALVITSK